MIKLKELHKFLLKFQRILLPLTLNTNNNLIINRRSFSISICNNNNNYNYIIGKVSINYFIILIKYY